MSEASQNPNWPLISKLQPQLRRHVCIYPQVYRGERWYILRDQSNGRHLRFSAPAYELIGRLNGDLTVEEARNRALTVLGAGTVSNEGLSDDILPDDILSEDDIITILTQLFSIDVLRSGLPTDAETLFNRFQHQRRLRRQSALMNPLAIRIHLLDPDSFLNLLIPWVRPLFSKAGVGVWLLVVGFAMLLTLLNFPSLMAAVDKDIFSAANIVSMILVFVGIKTVHEFAHAFAVKIWGGDVHDMGITILVLAPVPYVDASAAWGFRDKYKRILVGAVGIFVELFLASLALFIWLLVEPGLVKDAAFNALLIGSVSTLVFNANPLLRFDGYYVLQDLIEIPNLYSRASRYYLYLAQRYVFGINKVSSPVTADGESLWFIVYGLSALCYRLVLMVIIVIFLAEKYLFIGILLGAWSITMQIILPIIRGARFLQNSPKLDGNRVRANSISSALIGFICVVFLFFPVGVSTKVEGIVSVPDQSQVYVGATGFVVEVLVASGSAVKSGDPVLRMESVPLRANILKLQAQREELKVRIAAKQLNHQVLSDIMKEELKTIDAELALLREESASLLVRTEAEGTLVLPQAWRLTGRYLKKGELVGYILHPERLIVRSIVPQSHIGLIQQHVDRVEVRFAERLGEIIEVNISRMVPSGSITLPSRTLGTAGGGKIEVVLSDDSGLTATEKVFQVDLGLPKGFEVSGVGERVYVSFDHGTEPLARQWLRSGRQLILSRLAF